MVPRPRGRSLRRARARALRAADAAALRGWRAALALAIEAADALAPAARAAGARLGAAVTWLLATVVGRAAGLVARGVREGLGGSKRPRPREEEALRGAADNEGGAWWGGAATA